MAYDLTGFPALLMLLLWVLVLGFIYIYLPIKIVVTIVAHTKKKTDRVRLLQLETIITGYEPPADLTPAEVGFLFDTKLNNAETFATIVLLQQKGVAQIIEKNGKLFVADVLVTSAPLKEFEGYVLAQLHERKGEYITEQWLTHVSMDGSLTLRSQLRTQGYLKSTEEQILYAVLQIGGVILVLFLIYPILTLGYTSPREIVSSISDLVFGFPIYFILSLFINAKYQKIAGETWIMTKKLKGIWPDIEGYRDYIRVVEADKIRFDSDTTKGIIKNETLPYAIALGFDTGWQTKV